MKAKNYFRAVKLDQPIVFAFNILRGYHSNFGNSFFALSEQVLREEHPDTHLLALRNNGVNSIEDRAGSIKRHLPKFLSTLNAKKVHLITNSLAGLDFRYYISQLGGNEFISSITTISTPHRGSFLADSFVNRTITEEHIDPITRFLGVDVRSFKEVGTENIAAFNTVVVNNPDVKYFSIGGDVLSSKSSDLFKYSNRFILEKKSRHLYSDNDGVFAVDEIEWGKHLLNFSADHADLVGLGKYFDAGTVFRFIVDNLKYEFRQTD